jgi:CubicO group peptidase (beta-lactamase class C family)
MRLLRESSPSCVHRSVILAVSLALPSLPALCLVAGPPPNLDSDVQQLMTDLQVPGVSVAIVKDGEIVATKGYGIRRIGKTDRVDENTLFSICSNTKAFTAVALAQFVDEKKIAWDDPVIKYLPAFQMYDPYVTREMTIRDLMVHRSGLGLGAGDLLWNPPTSFTTEETVARIRFLKPTSSFRSKYAYDSLLYVVAGQVVATVAGKPWEQVVQERILGPAGMKSTNTSVRTLAEGPNSASPHVRDESGALNAGKVWATANVMAACGINSNARDMAQWVKILLAGGKLSGAADSGRLFSERQGNELWTLVTPIAISEPEKALIATKPNFLGYGLGFRVTDYRGEKMVYHTGTILGYSSRVTLFPNLKLGIVVLTNQSHSPGARAALTLRIADHYLAVIPTDWITVYRDLEREEMLKDREARIKEASARRPGSAPSLPLEQYAGKYVDAWFGEVSMAKEGDSLVLRIPKSPGLVGDMVHWQHDTFISRWRDRSLAADSYVTFDLNPDGSVSEVKMKPVSSQTDFSFDFHDLNLNPVR